MKVEPARRLILNTYSKHEARGHIARLVDSFQKVEAAFSAMKTFNRKERREAVKTAK